MFGGNGISGIAVLTAAAGLVLISSGLLNAPVAETLRAYLQGRRPQSGPSMLPASSSSSPGGGGSGSFGGAAGNGSATGQAVADRAQTYVGVKYVWGGHTPEGWDCSGFVTWVLHHDFGIELPNNTHTVTGQFYVWNGARTINRADMAAGDLVCWLGHIGIAVDNQNMVNAPGIGIPTRVQPVYDIPTPIIRRPLAYDPKAFKKSQEAA